MHARGAKTPSGTVQQLNSPRGAVLVQGLVAAMLLRERVHGLPITETHPKALLWLLGTASPARGHADVPLADVGESRGDSNGHDVSFDLDFQERVIVGRVLRAPQGYGLASRKSFTTGTMMDMRCISVTWVVLGKMANRDAERGLRSP
jgi:hypothetical protein